MPKHPSPLRYPGGKHALAPLLADVLIENDLHDGTVVEPFAGGAGAALRLMFDEYAARIILNDLDPHIYAFWRAVLHNTDELNRRVCSAKLTMKQWSECRRVYDASPSRQRQIELAFATFFLNRSSRSGILMGSGPIGGYDQKGPWKIDARFNKDDLVERIKRIATYRDRISVSRLDARVLLRNLRVPDERCLVYLDPPYFEKGQGLYLNAMGEDDHRELAEILRNDPPFKWVLTYDNASPIRKLYAGLRPRAFDLKYSAHGRGFGKELIIFDPRLEISRGLLSRHDRPGRLHFSRARRAKSLNSA